MGMHVTLHGKNDTPVNGQEGSWQPVKVNSAGQLSIALLNGELAQFNRLAGGAIATYVQITTNGTTVVSNGPCIVYGVQVVTAGTTSTVTVYDNTAGSGTLILNAAPTTTLAGMISTGISGVGLLLTTGLTVVTAGAAAATITILYAPAV